MDLPQQALQINGKFFFNLKFVFELIAENRKNIQRITMLGLCKRGGGVICADQHAL